MVAIDGSKFKAVNNRDKNFSRAKIKRRMEVLEKSLNQYFAQLESADREESSRAEIKKTHLKDKIKAVKKEMQRIKKIEEKVIEAPDKQISLTDPDARAMKARGSGVVGYNVQTAVDTKSHLIVAHEVTNLTLDRDLLPPMAKQARAAMGTEDLTALADRGYFKSEEILACDEAGITTYLPRPQTSNNQARGLFGKRDFHYIPKDDEYECPAGERLIYRFTREERGLTLHRYWSSLCPECPMKAQCTTG